MLAPSSFSASNAHAFLPLFTLGDGGGSLFLAGEDWGASSAASLGSSAARAARSSPARGFFLAATVGAGAEGGTLSTSSVTLTISPDGSSCAVIGPGIGVLSCSSIAGSGGGVFAAGAGLGLTEGLSAAAGAAFGGDTGTERAVAGGSSRLSGFSSTAGAGAGGGAALSSTKDAGAGSCTGGSLSASGILGGATDCGFC